MKTKKKEDIKVTYVPEFCCKDAEEAKNEGFVTFILGPLTNSAGFFIVNKAGKVRMIKFCPFCGARVENVEGKQQFVDDVEI